MATKKAASTAKKSTAKKPNASKQTSTKVTTVKAVESRPAHKAATASTNSRGLSLMKAPLAAALIAEFIGTFIFAAVVIAGQGQPILALFALAGVVFAVGSISGGYVNPALVIGSWLTRRMTGIRAVAYIIAQVLGAMLALVVLNAFVNAVPAQNPADAFSAAPALFSAGVLPEGKEWLILVAEFIGTLIFGFAAARAFSEKNDHVTKALTMGLGIFLGLMVAGSAAAFLGASAILNPAVAISLQAIDFSSVWPIAVYVIGSTLGAVAGFGLYKLLRNTRTEDIEIA